MAKSKKFEFSVENMELVTSSDLLDLALMFLASSGVIASRINDDEKDASPAQALGTAVVVLSKATEMAGEYFSLEEGKD